MIAESRLRNLADSLETTFDADFLALTEQLDADGDLDSWLEGMVEGVALAAILFYLLGRGGRTQATANDWADLVEKLNDQYRYLSAFAQRIANGNLSVQQVNANAAMYYATARGFYQNGRAAAYGLTLPAHPRDGSSECLSNCKCWWNIKEYADRYEATWQITAGESCATCLSRAAMWNPYIVYK